MKECFAEIVLFHLSPAINLVLQTVMKLHVSVGRKVVNPRIYSILHVDARLPPLAPVDAPELQADRYRETNRNWLKMKLKLDNVNKRFKRFKGLLKCKDSTQILF